MSNTNTTTKTKKRITYGFKLDFPETFTLRSLRRKRHDLSYITAYMRVKNALKNGEIVVTGKQEPNRTRKGRKELVYSRVNAKTSAVTASKEVVAVSDLC